jgi:hypothetical protein
MASRRKPDAPLTDSGALYSPRDFKAGTDAVEKDTDSAWQLWLDANKTAQASGTDPRYARTAPQGLTTEPGALSRASAAGAGRLAPATVEEAMVEMRRNNRVCPRPRPWQMLYDMLPEGKLRPDPPLIDEAWNTTASINKRTLLRKQLQWAADHGRLDAVMDFLESLPEDVWFHMDD